MYIFIAAAGSHMYKLGACILELITIAEIAKKLNLAESTVRYYRNRFSDYIPAVGTGRKKRYKPEAAEVIRVIAEGFSRKLTAVEVQEELDRVFPRFIDVDPEPQLPTAAAQQQPDFIQLLQIIADQKQDKERMDQEIEQLNKRLEEQELRMRYLDEDVRMRFEIREQMFRDTIERLRSEMKQKKWWHFLKK